MEPLTKTINVSTWKHLGKTREAVLTIEILPGFCGLHLKMLSRFRPCWFQMYKLFPLLVNQLGQLGGSKARPDQNQ